MTSRPDYRPVSPEEISLLESRFNTAENWKNIFIHRQTDLQLITHTHFAGTVYIGALTTPEDGEPLPAGISRCRLKNVYIGDHCRLHDVGQLSDYTIGDRCVIFNVGIMLGTRPLTPFEIKVTNENGGRAILAFPGMNTADAWIQNQCRDDKLLHEQLRLLAADCYKPYGGIAEIGADSRIYNCQSIRSAYTGSHVHIENIISLNNCFIASSKEGPSFLENGVVLENVILDRQNHIRNNALLSNVATGENVHVENGARVSDCMIGANSHIACGELISNLLFPFHEQHHNNSFLIASTIEGQCNIAAGATIGSNHNSRAADGELFAGRGFWPGLETDFKHNSHFAPFTLVAKASFEKELNIHLPFSLISKNPQGRVVIYPGYWYYHNMYALARNAWKFTKRDKRLHRSLHIETDFLGPDSLTAMIRGIDFLRKQIDPEPSLSALLENTSTVKAPRHVEAGGLVYGDKAVILNPLKGILAYAELLIFFCGRLFLREMPGNTMPLVTWENFGGQFIPGDEADTFRKSVRAGDISSWKDIHRFYREQAAEYGSHLSGLANHIAAFLLGKKRINDDDRESLKRKAAITAEKMLSGAKFSRQKDFENEYRLKSYRNSSEMTAVVGCSEDDPFLTDYTQTMEYVIKALRGPSNL